MQDVCLCLLALPVSHHPTLSRRSQVGARKCGVHTPSPHQLGCRSTGAIRAKAECRTCRTTPEFRRVASLDCQRTRRDGPCEPRELPDFPVSLLPPNKMSTNAVGARGELKEVGDVVQCMSAAWRGARGRWEHPAARIARGEPQSLLETLGAEKTRRRSFRCLAGS